MAQIKSPGPRRGPGAPLRRSPAAGPTQDPTAIVFRNPLITTIRGKPSVQTEIFRNFVLLAAVTAPFSQKQWDNPVAPGRALQETTLGRPPDRIVPPPPFFQNDYPNPRGPRPVTQWDQIGYQPNLIIAPPPFIQSATDLPVQPVVRRQGFEQAGYPAVASTAPFAQTDWQFPQGIRRALQDGNQSRPPDRIVPPPPFYQTDQPNPVLRVALRQGFELPGYPFVSQGAPFIQTDWPVPKGAARALQEGTAGAFIATLPVFIAPTAQYDWPVPGGFFRQYQTGTAGTYPALFPVPVYPYDYQNPRAPLRALQEGTTGSLPFYFPAATNPFFQNDWPNPRIDPRLLQVRWWFEGAPLPNLIPPAVIPPPDTQQPAGRKRKRYLVEIDGQDFEVASLADARTLLEQAREVALSHAPEIVESTARKRVETGRPVHLPQALIETDEPALRPLVVETRRAITDIYRKAAIDAEIRLRMEQQRRRDDDEDDEDVFLLL